MKKFAKFMSVLLALALILSLAITASAEGEPTITITGAKVDEVYDAYRILNVVDAGDATHATYKVNTDWREFVEAHTEYLAVSDNGYVTWINDDADDNGTAINAFVADAKAYIAEKNLSPDATGTGAASGETVTAVITVPALGYYVVNSSLGSVCSVDTVNRNVQIAEKNPEPTIVKEAKVKTAGVGETVPFEVTIHPQPSDTAYTLTDKMSAGLTFDFDSVKINGTSVANGDVARPGEDDDFTFQITIPAPQNTTDIVVTYSATVNSAAITEIQHNDAVLHYGEAQTVTARDVVETTIEIPVLKYTLNGETKEGLGGAVFTLTKGETVMKFSKDTATGAYYPDENGEYEGITSPADGLFKFKGLSEGTYTLTETTAPDGFNEAAPVTIEITTTKENSQFTTTMKQDNVEATRIEVLNLAGSRLPSTGGIGTTIFYIAGAVLVLGAGIVLIVRKRMSFSK